MRQKETYYDIIVRWIKNNKILGSFLLFLTGLSFALGLYVALRVIIKDIFGSPNEYNQTSLINGSNELYFLVPKQLSLNSDTNWYREYNLGIDSRYSINSFSQITCINYLSPNDTITRDLKRKLNILNFKPGLKAIPKDTSLCDLDSYINNHQHQIIKDITSLNCNISMKDIKITKAKVPIKSVKNVVIPARRIEFYYNCSGEGLKVEELITFFNGTAFGLRLNIPQDDSLKLGKKFAHIIQNCYIK
jgi:hypothetical protein